MTKCFLVGKKDKNSHILFQILGVNNIVLIFSLFMLNLINFQIACLHEFL